MRHRFAGLLLLMLMASSASAQTGKHFSLGAGIDFSKYADSDFKAKNPGATFAYRINPKPEAPDGWRWGFKTGLGYSKRSTTTEIGGIRTKLGRLQMIQILVGGQRSLRQGPWQVGIGVVAGPSFNHYDVDAGARDAYQTRLGTTLDRVKVGNSIAVKPEANAWYNLNRWFALQGTLSYIVNRPKAETTVGGVTSSSHWKTDHASVGLSLVVGIF